jgi:hypothetical protein
MDGPERLKWFANSSAGPASLAGGAITSAFGTWSNSPREYGPHWEGYGKRNGMRLTGVATGNAMEAGLGALWGEDPRYVRAVGQPLKGRVWQVSKMTFLAQNARGGTSPAYARFAADAGSNFLSNTWRAQSEADAQHAGTRIAWGILGRMGGNAFAEFWPSVWERLKPK